MLALQLSPLAHFKGNSANSSARTNIELDKIM